jgi:hypothetical protein
MADHWLWAGAWSVYRIEDCIVDIFRSWLRLGLFGPMDYPGTAMGELLCQRWVGQHGLCLAALG